MRPIRFTEEDRRALAHDRYYYPDPRVQRKMEVLWLKSLGLPHDRIALYAGVSRRTLQRYLNEYRDGGLAALRRCPWHHPEGALAGHESSLEEVFRQAAFVRDELEPRLEQARRGGRQVYFVDAAHFVFAPFLGSLWCAARLFVRAASGRKRYNVLGAPDAVSHRLIRVTNDGYINAESVCDLLRAVAESAVGLPITLVLDNARYQKCALVQGLAASLGIELLYLPGYSPNLNLIERLWRFVRKQSLDSIYHEDFAQFQAAIDGCLNNLTTVHKAEMDTLLTHKFQMFEDVPLLAA